MEKEKFCIKKYTRETEIGKQYGSLKVIDFIEHHTVNGKYIKAKAFVKCLNCNSKSYKDYHSLIKHKLKNSCSCISITKHLFKIKHGLRNHPYYNNCKNAIRRCKPDD